MKEKFFVYLIKSETKNKTYTGFTTDVVKRLQQHNNGESGYTKGREPWKLIWYGVFPDRELAESFEKYLKTGSGIAFARKRLFRYSGEV